MLVTGAVQSNLARLAAAGARRLGMDVDVQLEERVVDAGALHRASGNLLLDRLLGATLHAFPLGEDEAAADAALERRARLFADEGRRPYVIHSAPGHPPLGGLGYVLAAEEVTAQARALGVGFDAVVCASGSALTHVGVLVGLRALGEAAPVYGICVRRDARRQGDRVAKVAAELARLIEHPAAFDAGGVEVSDAVHAPGYGRLNDAVREAMAMAARHEALLLDPVYTGKAMAGLVAHVRAGRIAEGGPGLVQDPFPERPHLRPLPGGRRGDEAATFGRLVLAVEEGDQGPALQLPCDEHRASDGGADAVHRGLDQHAVEAEARGPRQVRRGLALAGEPVRPVGVPSQVVEQGPAAELGRRAGPAARRGLAGVGARREGGGRTAGRRGASPAGGRGARRRPR